MTADAMKGQSIYSHIFRDNPGILGLSRDLQVKNTLLFSSADGAVDSVDSLLLGSAHALLVADLFRTI